MPPPLAEASLPSLPSAAQDPVERRRLLNILAQRRYRNRKRARLASLETQLKAQPSSETSPWQEIDFQSQLLDSSLLTTSISTEETDFQTFTSADTVDYDDKLSQPALYDPFSFGISSFPNPDGSTDFAPPQSQPQPQSLSTSSTSMAFSTDPSQPHSEPFPGRPAAEDEDALRNSRQNLLDKNPASSEIESYATFPTTTTTSSHQILDHAWGNRDISAPPPSVRPTTSISPTTPTAPSVNFDFNDEAFITTPGLSTIRAHTTILSHMHAHSATRIDLFDPFAISPFYQPALSSPNAPSPPVPPPSINSLFGSLPPNYRPTPLQLSLPHHPLLDLLPWPAVRSRILYTLTLPDALRPQRARGDMSTVTMQLMFDIKDAGGGLRVWGSNPFDERNWEVGPVFFRGWWWALDGGVVGWSNRMREGRGEGALRFREVE